MSCFMNNIIEVFENLPIREKRNNYCKTEQPLPMSMSRVWGRAGLEL